MRSCYKLLCTLFSPFLLIGTLAGQAVFSEASWVGSSSVGRALCSFDVDGDGDVDVCAVTDRYLWEENNGGSFSYHPINPFTWGQSHKNILHVADLNDDGAPDLIAVQYSKIVWLENNANESDHFAAEQTIANVTGIAQVFPADLDGDGDVDIATASGSPNEIAWYENLGNGIFGSKTVVSTTPSGAMSVFAIDLDGDGDHDLLSASWADDTIAWYQNLGNGNFGPHQVITTNADSARCVYAADVDGDGDADVLSASQGDDKIAWYENLGSGAFGTQSVISTDTAIADKVNVADLDNDGDMDVVSVSRDMIAWYMNLGGGNFGGLQPIVLPESVLEAQTADFNGDGRNDIVWLTATGKLKWNENHQPTYPGSCTDLRLLTSISVNDDPAGFPDSHTFYTSWPLTIRLDSPGGTYSNVSAFLALQLFPSWAILPGNVFFSEVQLSTASSEYPILLLWNNPPLGFTSMLPLQGTYSVPASLSGKTIRFQGFVMGPNPNNAFFTTSNAHEIVVM